MTAYLVSRPINGISINGKEFLLNHFGKPCVFLTEEEAKQYLISIGYTALGLEEDLEKGGVCIEKGNLIGDTTGFLPSKGVHQ